MSAPPPLAPKRPAASPAAVPAFFLYGEPLRPPDERLVHIETIATRSSVHEWVIRPHRHRDLHQVLLIQKGRVEAKVDDRAARLAGPAAITVPPAVVHSFRFQPDTIGLVISFAAGLPGELATVSPGLREFLERADFFALDRGALKETDLLALGEMLLREFGRSAPGRIAALRGLLGALLANLLRLVNEPSATDSANRSRERELVARFRERVEQRFRQHPAIAEYATQLQTSEGRLRHACIEVTGQSPAELVHLRLIVEAERQLRYTSMSVAEIAYFLGFEDPAYFSRFFAHRMGMSPREFRRRDDLLILERG
jgi:AraC family transcriptional regulator, transcriptional activator of pobA